MAEYQIVYWKAAPVMVTARNGRSERVSLELPPRFQAAVDEAAMRLGLSGSDAYLDGWNRSEWIVRPGSAETVAQAVAAELDAEYDAERLRTLLVG